MLNVIFGFPSKALRSVKGYISDFAELSDVFVPNGGLPPTIVETDFAKKLFWKWTKVLSTTPDTLNLL